MKGTTMNKKIKEQFETIDIRLKLLTVSGIFISVAVVIQSFQIRTLQDQLDAAKVDKVPSTLVDWPMPVVLLRLASESLVGGDESPPSSSPPTTKKRER